jgi:hypothetical protein
MALALAGLLSANAFAASSSSASSDGDQWELATAADASGHLYMLYPQYKNSADCAACWTPSMTLLMSDDNGSHWDAPRGLTPPGSAQVQPQMTIDSGDHRTVYATWLEDSQKSVVVAKSSDYGQSWSIVLADHAAVAAERPIIAAFNQQVYLGFSRAGKLRVATSKNGAINFSTATVDAAAKALPGGLTIDSDGGVYVAWSQYVSNRVLLKISKLEQSGSWTTSLMDISRAPDGCSDYHCAWGYMGADISIASDAAGVLYALWTSSIGGSPERVYFASSTTHGDSWSARTGVSNADANVRHARPMIAAGAAGQVRIAWMDSRHTPEWDTYSRSSTNGGATWSDETIVSAGKLSTSAFPVTARPDTSESAELQPPAAPFGGE